MTSYILTIKDKKLEKALLAFARTMGIGIKKAGKEVNMSFTNKIIEKGIEEGTIMPLKHKGDPCAINWPGWDIDAQKLRKSSWNNYT